MVHLLSDRDGPNFAEHDMKVDEFLVFHYVPDDQHFIVQIFRTSGCEKINFDSYICKGKQNERTYQETTTYR
ncbi:hypothetical protein MTR67_051488 [Solanum verrucosum]|uniref:Uncharacterized protein n=1 Tax=Solanum verrucosum TaxID=315347 RepID=A0AAF0V3D8_SOLVR|nr:hypothetical protein MTR67_051488 [Solanum verrucosum]